jgi:hypothetical protein
MIDSGPNYFNWPLKSITQSSYEYDLALREHRKQYFLQFQGPTDVDTYLNVWSSLMDSVGGPEAPSDSVKDWCKLHSINYSKINEVLTVTTECIRVLKNLWDISIETGPFGVDSVTTLLKPLLEITYADRKFSYNDNNEIRTQYIDSYHNIYSMGTAQSINEIQGDPPEFVIALITSTIHSTYGNFKLIDCCV